jgi:hypothetical protein
VGFAGAIVRELRKNIPLIPFPIRLLAKRLSQLESPQFPYLKFLVFDAMFVNYIEHFLMHEYTKWRRDICQALRSGYPSKFFTNHLSKVLAKPIAAHPLGISLFWERLQADVVDVDPLSLGIASCEQMSLFCGRDLGLIFHGVDLFLRYGNGEGAAELVVKFAGLSPPENEGVEKIFAIRNWGIAPKGPDPIPPAPHGFAELFSVLTTINSTHLRYGSPRELADRALLYGGLFLNGSEKVMLSNVPKSFGELPDALAASASHAAVVQKFSLTIFDALFHIGDEIERNRCQSLRLLELYIRKDVIRALQEAHPFELALDAFSPAPARERTAQFLRAIDSYITPLQFPPAHNSLIQRALVLSHIDEMEHQTDAQVLAWNLKLHGAFMAMAQDQRGRTFGRTPVALDRVRLALAMVGVRERPSVNLRLVMHAMTFLTGATPDDVRGVIASVGNPAIFGFIGFILPFATDRAVVAVLFGDAGVLPLQLFIMAGNALREEVGAERQRTTRSATAPTKRRKKG